MSFVVRAFLETGNDFSVSNAFQEIKCIFRTDLGSRMGEKAHLMTWNDII